MLPQLPFCGKSTSILEVAYFCALYTGTLITLKIESMVKVIPSMHRPKCEQHIIMFSGPLRRVLLAFH